MQIRVLAVAIAMLATSTVAAQAKGTDTIYPNLRVSSLMIQGTPRPDPKPSFVAPLVITAAGFSVGAGSLVLGVLATMGTCSSPPPEPGMEPDPSLDEPCDRSIPTPLVVTGIVGGSVGLLGSIWLIERLIARHQYNEEQPRSSLMIMPTAGGAQLVGRF